MTHVGPTFKNSSHFFYPGGFFAVFAVLSLVAVATGCLIAALNGVPAGVWSPDLAAWGVGAVAAWTVSRLASPVFARIVILAAPVGLLASLAGPGQVGVHRWLDLGPVHANVATLLLPAFIVAMAVLACVARWIWPACAVCAVALILQPDASQAAALAAAVLLTVARLPMGSIARTGILVAVSFGVAAAWLRPDPLTPVPEVEGIIALAYTLSPVLTVVAVVALGGATLSPVMIAARPERLTVQTAALALSAYLVLSALAPLFGAFPVPLVGISMSPIIGFWLGVGLLSASVSWRDVDGSSSVG